MHGQYKNIPFHLAFLRFEDVFFLDLKTLYKLLGTKEVVFLFTDAHVALEGFLEFLNNMLTTGMVPALYEQDEMDGIDCGVL